MRHAEAIRKLEDYAYSLELLGHAKVDTVSRFYADQCLAEAKALQATIEFLKSPKGQQHE